MPVPDFQQFFRPELELLKDGKPRHLREIESALAEEFGTSQDDLEELLPNSKQSRFQNRVQWGLSYLRQAKLIESTGRGINKISSRGLSYLEKAPKVIKKSDLMQFPEYVEFTNRSKLSTVQAKTKSKEFVGVESSALVPEEQIQESYREHNAALAQEVLDRVKGISPALFEQLIVDLMLRLGYGGAGEDSGQTLGKSGDEGVDGVINQDKLGLEKIYLQAKRWSDGKVVGRKEVQSFVGALTGQGASKGVFITTSTFTKEAANYVRNIQNFKVSLVDGLQLADLMIEYDLGVAVVARYDVKRVDSDFFGD